jgi:uncharacterized protein
MSPAHATNFAELHRTLADLRLGIGAAELHGSLTGFLCAGGMAHAGSWLHDLALDEVADALRGEPQREIVDRMFADCADELDDPDLAFTPLLPTDDSPIQDRAAALVEWCRGFLGGLGLSGTTIGEGLSGDATEILSDVGRIAATRFDEGESAEDDEDAYAEVVEYVRVGVLLLHTELARPPDEATRH